MKKNISILVLLVIMFFSCQSEKYDGRLLLVDSLLTENLNDSAIAVIRQIEPSEYTERNRAYYHFLLTFAKFKIYEPISEESVIDNCINTFSRYDDKEKLAWSYFLKSSILIDLGKDSEAVDYLKKAEYIVASIPNSELRIRVAESLSYVNSKSGNNQRALYYIRKVLDEALTAKKKRWIGHAYRELAYIYSKMGERDSFACYSKLYAPYTKYASRQDQPYFLNNLAIFYKGQKDYEKAESCLVQSLKVYPIAHTYGTLAGLYTDEGRLEEAGKLWNQALETKDDILRSSFLLPYAEWLYGIGRTDDAWDVVRRIPYVKDSILNARVLQTEGMKELQEENDRQKEALRYRKRIELYLSGLILLAFLLLILWGYYHMKSQRQKKQLAENQLLITEYTKQVEALEKEGKEQSKEVVDLKRKIDMLRNKQSEILYKGKARYEEIVGGANTAQWRRADFADFMEYYRMVNLPFMVQLEEDYRSLSSSQKFFLSLYELGFDDARVKEVMNLTDGALRTTKSRIRARLQGVV